MNSLVSKYNVPAPRYTSYPTVPYWDTACFEAGQWKETVKTAAAANEVSIYVHLPFCESLCTYCGCNTRITKNHGVEKPYIDALLMEWSLYRKLFSGIPRIKELHLGGGTPTFFNPANLHRLITGLLKDCDIAPGAVFSIEGHPVNTSPEHLQTLAGLNFKRLSLGIQDFDPRVQEVINRFQSVAQVEAVTRQARGLGYTSVNYDLVYGLPLQSPGGLQRTLWQALEFRPDRIAFYSYAHVPWLKPGQRKFTEKDLPSVTQKQELYELGRELLVHAGYREIGMDHFALPSDSLFLAEAEGSLHRNFMGYTEQHTPLLIGLGVSAISDSELSLAQNEKKVEDYLTRITQQQLAVFKGHQLTPEDRIIRKHILNLMCKGETAWNHADPVENRILTEAVIRLQPLAADGLVTVAAGNIHVKPAGKRFLRNICMMLDVRLWDEHRNRPAFSMAG